MTDREQLDAFFARAEDVLAEWQPSDDAMVAQMCDAREFELYSDAGYAEFWLPVKQDQPPSSFGRRIALPAACMALITSITRRLRNS